MKTTEFPYFFSRLFTRVMFNSGQFANFSIDKLVTESKFSRFEQNRTILAVSVMQK